MLTKKYYKTNKETLQSNSFCLQSSGLLRNIDIASILTKSIELVQLFIILNLDELQLFAQLVLFIRCSAIEDLFVAFTTAFVLFLVFLSINVNIHLVICSFNLVFKCLDQGWATYGPRAGSGPQALKKFQWDLARDRK